MGNIYTRFKELKNQVPKDCIRIFVIMGKPNSITGLDEGIFCSIHKYDEKYINVMSEARFKDL